MLKICRNKEKNEFPEVLNQEQAARFPGLSCPTLRKYLLEKKIPGRIPGNRYLFSKTALLRWLESDIASNDKNHYSSQTSVFANKK